MSQNWKTTAKQKLSNNRQSIVKSIGYDKKSRIERKGTFAASWFHSAMASHAKMRKHDKTIENKGEKHNLPFLIRHNQNALYRKLERF